MNRIKEIANSLKEIDIPWHVCRVTGMSPRILICNDGGIQYSLSEDGDFVNEEELMAAIGWWVSTLGYTIVAGDKQED